MRAILRVDRHDARLQLPGVAEAFAAVRLPLAVPWVSSRARQGPLTWSWAGQALATKTFQAGTVLSLGVGPTPRAYG
jgi:hypothetical protein